MSCISCYEIRSCAWFDDNFAPADLLDVELQLLLNCQSLTHYLMSTSLQLTLEKAFPKMVCFSLVNINYRQCASSFIWVLAISYVHWETYMFQKMCCQPFLESAAVIPVSSLLWDPGQPGRIPEKNKETPSEHVSVWNAELTHSVWFVSGQDSLDRIPK